MPAARSVAPRVLAVVPFLFALSPPAASAQDWVRAVLGDDAAASGAFACESSLDGSRWSATCLHPSLRTLHAVEDSVEPGPAFRATVCRALKDRGYTAPNGALEVSASGVVRAGRQLPDSATVYFLLYVPFTTEATLAVTATDPGSGAPWLHQAGTCTAHVMWSERRAVSRAEGH